MIFYLLNKVSIFNEPAPLMLIGVRNSAIPTVPDDERRTHSDDRHCSLGEFCWIRRDHVHQCSVEIFEFFDQQIKFGRLTRTRRRGRW